MTNLDEAEHQRLQNAINDAERLFGGKLENQLGILAAKIQPLKTRVETLQTEIIQDDGHYGRKRSEAAQQLAIALLASQEYALSHEEKATYAEFLYQDYFTREDFGVLETFYADGGAFDRLSEGGKKQMSERIWAGIEQGGYTHAELPHDVRRKNLDELAKYIEQPENAPDTVKRMNPEVRAGFMRAYESGDKEQAEEILNSQDLFESSTKVKTQAATERSEVAEGGDFKGSATREQIDDQDASELAALTSIPATSISSKDLTTKPSGINI
ncbi:hypothetical protein N9891_00040 [bacterium]|nr:hypothetical protein [bacterium]